MFLEYSLSAVGSNARATQQNLFSLLQTCNTIRKLTQIHTQVLLNGFSQKNFILVKLISFYITFGRLLYARRAFGNIINPSTAVWNQMLKGFAANGKPRESIELYNQMVASGAAMPDGYTYSFLLSACARSGMVSQGEQVHGRVLTKGFCSNVYVRTNLINLYATAAGGINYARRVFDEMREKNVVSWNSLLSGYFRCGDVDSARRVFDEMPERNVVSWTTMVAGCAQNGQSKQALFLFNEMQVAGFVELDQVALIAALSACAELGDLKMGEWIHYYIKQRFDSQNQPLLVSLNNALIHMYASCGEIQKAHQVFQKMQKTSTVSWTSMITGFAKQGFAQEALVIFKRMLSLGDRVVRPDEITFIGVLCACSHAGLVDDGHYFFKKMIHKWGIKPRIQHYCCLVDLLSRAGFLDEAVNLIETMPVKPNDAVWGALLGGCRIHKNATIASKVAQQLSFEQDPEYAVGYLVLVANVYAGAKKWQDVATVRRKMIDMGMKKPAGRSWIQVNGAVDSFMAGDRTHKNASLIHDMLENVSQQAKQEGRMVDILQVSLDAE